MAKITMTVSAKLYGLPLAYAVMRVMMSLGLPERTCLSAGRCVTFVRLKLGGKHASWHWLGRMANGPAQ